MNFFLRARAIELSAAVRVKRRVKSSARILERELVQLLFGYEMTLEDLVEHQVVVHRLGGNARHLLVLELNEPIALVAARPLRLGQPQAHNLAELREVALYLVLVEAVRQMANVHESMIRLLVGQYGLVLVQIQLLLLLFYHSSSFSLQSQPQKNLNMFLFNSKY